MNSEDLNTIEEEVNNTRYQLPFLISLHTGMRRGEVLGLTWDNIDFNSKRITIEKQLQRQGNGTLLLVSTKTDSSIRKFKMTSSLYTALQKASEDFRINQERYGEYFYKGNDFVCCNEDGSPINPQSLSLYFRKVSKRLDIPFSFHDLRHTHATMLLEADVNMKVIQERLGHSNISTTFNVYSHLTDKMEDKTIDKFDRFFE
ncbi:MAG: site-specific integrase [Turicibacter sp.]|nr:site-specific integrase [Turicibacter sp.]